jgi:hypothetical protein
MLPVRYQTNSTKPSVMPIKKATNKTWPMDRSFMPKSLCFCVVLVKVEGIANTGRSFYAS